MKRYRFRLEQVLRVRAVQEDLAASELAMARAAEAAAVASAEARLATIAARPRPAGSMSGAELATQRILWDAELGALAGARSLVSERAAGTSVARDEWMGARQRVRALEVLDERQRDDHAVAADRDDAARVDDLVVSRFARRSASALEEGVR
ncbi:MAG: flagellar FliJ family protein [Actinomycetota bacterium]|nr:flagellar FliJ family protein [Actinomycetota bacterium]